MTKQLVKVTTDGTIERIDLDGPVNDYRVMAGHIGCEWVQMVPVSSELDFWADEEGLVRGEPVVNQLASRFLGGAVVGNIVFATRDGDTTIGLDPSQNTELINALKDLGGVEE